MHVFITLFNLIVDKLYTLYRLHKGKSRVRLYSIKKVDLGELIGFSIRGYTLTIHCYKMQYVTSYQKRFEVNKNHVVYQMFATCSEDSPQKLKEVIEIETYLPRLSPSLVSIEQERKTLVAAYLDILITRLRNLDR